MKRTAALVVGCLLVLTGCAAPDVEHAVWNCMNAVVTSLRAEGEEITHDRIKAATAVCEQEYQADPEAFLELWAD